MLSERQVSFFSRFGFVVLPGWFSGAENEVLIKEGLSEIDRIYHDREGGPKGKWAPLIGASTPFHASLLGPERFLPLAEQLMGRDIYGVLSDILLWEGDTGWHRDQDVPCDTGIKFLYYPEKHLTADCGALRVLPGTHVDDEFRRQIPDELETIPVSASEFTEDRLTATHEVLEKKMPSENWCAIVETAPGDVIAFATPLYHSSFNGASGRMICATIYFVKPSTPEGIESRRQEAEIIPKNHQKMFNYPAGRTFHSPEWVRTIQDDPARRHWIDALKETGWLSL
ncbi:MAG: phytanoyl-CoA dioxygenase family protein [Planctomycetota bacterium]|jgi:hypothetical protein|nr:phytanoyl-CoA dioxygenase family protein [Planctomycetota bacterium]MDP6503679.1 phytanoyl-CoA dioxygenase family protein [Planctomycetota bacterium]